MNIKTKKKFDRPNQKSKLKSKNDSNYSPEIRNAIESIKKSIKVYYLRFHILVDNLSSITIYSDSKIKIGKINASIYATYFSFLLKNPGYYLLSDYIKKSGLEKQLGLKQDLSIGNFRTAENRFYGFFNNLICNEAKEISEAIREAIIISSKNKQDMIGFFQLPDIQFVAFWIIINSNEFDNCLEIDPQQV